MIVSHNLNDVFEVADRIAVLHLGRMAAVRPIAELDRQIVVDLMTTGRSTRIASVARRAVRLGRWRPARTRPSRRPTRWCRPSRRRRSVPDYLRASWARDQGRRHRRAAGRRRAAARLRAVPGAQRPVPHRRQPGQPAGAGRGVQPAGDGRRSSRCCSARSTCRSGSSPASAPSSWPSWSSPRPAGRGGRRSAPRWSLCALIGVLQGSLITRIGLPSFVVTLAGLLFWQGVMLRILGERRIDPHPEQRHQQHRQRQPDAARRLGRDAGHRRRLRGLDLPAATPGAGRPGSSRRRRCSPSRRSWRPSRAASGWCCCATPTAAAPSRSTACRGSSSSSSPSSPCGPTCSGRTRFGRYVYAIGGNAEAARRAGINLARIRTIGVRAVLAHGRHRRRRLRLPAALDLDRDRRGHPGALRGGGRGHRRHQPVRRSRQGAARRARRPRHRGDRQRHGPAGVRARPPSTSSPRSCSSSR